MKNLLCYVLFFLVIFVTKTFAQNPDLIFSHRYHAEEVGAACADCHSAAETSLSPQDNLLPDMATCYSCHDEDETDCTVCHIDPDEAREVKRISDLQAKFAHKLHYDNDIACVICHAEIEKKVVAEMMHHLPSNQICTDCHGNTDYTEGKATCLQCHVAEFDFTPQDHSLQWSKNHGIESQVSDQTCAHCHQNNYCLSCHEGDNLDHVVHPLNFRMNHGILAKGNKQDCTTCHQEQAFCIECHQTELVMPRNHSLANWANRNDGGRHARAALFDLDSCISCHNDAYADISCVECHN